MKILHITAEALRGGCEKNCYHFIKGSLHHTHQVLVLGQPGPMSGEWQALKIELNHLNILHLNLLFFFTSLRKAIPHEHYDMIICWSTVRLPLQLFCLHDKSDSVRVHLGNPVNTSYRPLKDQILDFLFPVSKRKVVLIACSRYVADSHLRTKYFNLFTIRVSLNPVDLILYSPAKAPTNDFFNIGMVARLDPIKDHDTVIRGFSQLYKQVPGARLHLVGDGKLRHQLEKTVRELAIQKVVFFYGDVKDVYAHLQKWDLFVYATTPAEGLGSVVAEAMVNGLPCILSDLPMLRELAPHEDLALWFDPGSHRMLADKMVALYENTNMREELGKHARNHALTHFTVERFINDYVN